MEDFQALGGAGTLTVVVQNTGTVTSEYSVCYYTAKCNICTHPLIVLQLQAVCLIISHNYIMCTF